MLKNSVATLLLTSMLAACSMTTSGTSHPDAAAAAKGEREVYSSLDGLLEGQANDLAHRMGWQDASAQSFKDYDVVVYHGGPSVGSLLQGVRGNLLNRSACVPANVSETDINAFGTHNLDTRNAIKIGAISKLPFGFNGGLSNTTSYSLQDAKLQLLDADELAQLVASPACAARIAKADGPVWIVRGVIKAKRSYKFYRSRSASLSFKAADAPSTGDGAGTNNGEVTDDASRPYFMILSPVKPERSRTPPVPDGAAAANATCSGRYPNQIYIQRSISEPQATGIAVQRALLTKFAVENYIQPVSVTPDVADVRYYNDDDRAAALCAVSILRQKGYPNARINRRDSLKAPKTLEVWLPRMPAS